MDTTKEKTNNGNNSKEDFEKNCIPVPDYVFTSQLKTIRRHKILGDVLITIIKMKEKRLKIESKLNKLYDELFLFDKGLDKIFNPDYAIGYEKIKLKILFDYG